MNPDLDRALADVEAAFSLDEQWRATWTDWPQSAPPNGAMTDVDRGRLLGWLRTLAAAVRELEARLATSCDIQHVAREYAHEQTERADKAESAYDELIMAVVNKYPGESRHQTALRYIQRAETSSADAEARQKGTP